MVRTVLTTVVIALAACRDEALLEPRTLTLVRVSGHDQAGTVGERLAAPLAVRVTGFNGRGVAGLDVTFTAASGGGSTAPSRVVTGPDGRAATTFTLGPIPGEQSAIAAILVPHGDTGPASVPVTFTATAAPGPPATISAARGNRQTGCAGWELVHELVAQVEDRFGNALSGVTVTWSVTGGSGALVAADIATNERGEARARLALGNEPGTNAADATATGLAPIRFTATALTCQAEGSIAFASPQGIEVMNPDGSGRALFIPGTLADPAWSPDGARLAFVGTSADGRTCSIYAARADGLDGRAVTPHVEGQCDRAPAWSPDGAQIAFVRGRALAVVNTDGSGLRLLPSTGGSTVSVGDLTWAPHEMTIAFTVTRRAGMARPRFIAVVNADGAGDVVTIRSGASAPAWSPDGALLAFVSGGDIGLMIPDGSSATSLGLVGLSPSAVGWSPDGTEIVFAGRAAAGPHDLYVVRRDGTVLRQLTRTDEPESDPTWRR
jgi:hypothetical protein